MRTYLGSMEWFAPHLHLANPRTCAFFSSFLFCSLYGGVNVCGSAPREVDSGMVSELVLYVRLVLVLAYPFVRSCGCCRRRGLVVS
jgi:hypothetical protein